MRVVIVFLLLLVTCQQASADTLRIISGARAVPVGNCISLLKDPEGTYGIQDVMRLSNSFRTSNSEVPVYAKEDTYVWARIVLVNGTGRDLWLWMANAFMDTIYYYEHSPLGWQTKLSGDKVAFQKRDILSNRVYFHITNTTAPVEIFMRFNIRIPRQFPLYVMTADVLMEEGGTKSFVDGLFYGLVVLIIIYNLLLWSTMRRNFYLYYIGYILFASLLLLHIDGVTYAYIWTNYPVLNDHPAVIAALAMFFAVLFVSSFLGLRQQGPGLMKGLWFFSALLMFSAVLSLAGYKYPAITMVELAAFSGSVYFLVTGVVLYRRGYKPARYYLAAWGVLITCLLIFLSQALAVIPYTTFTVNALKIGIGAESVLMAFAVVDSINYFRLQKKKAETEKARECQQRKKAEEELKHAERVLADYTARLLQKNALIEKFRHDLQLVEQKHPGRDTHEAKGETAAYLQQLMQSIILTEDDWLEFRQLFDKVHTGYIYRLKERYPGLTETETRLLTLLRLRLSSHEMANMLGVGLDAIRKAKQRLRRKLHMEMEGNLEELVSTV